jgi:hypothetical protein
MGPLEAWESQQLFIKCFKNSSLCQLATPDVQKTQVRQQYKLQIGCDHFKESIFVSSLKLSV